MISFFRKLSLMLAVIMTLGSLEPAYVFADEITVNKRSEYKEISDVQVTNLELPTPGKPLAKTATVTSAEGESWEIPVIWIDDTGKTVTVAEPGRKYYPTFSFYLPGGYKLKGASASGSFDLKLSPALAAVFGTTGFTYVYDPATAITYLTYTPAFVPGISSTTTSSTDGKKETSKDSSKSQDEEDDDDDDDEKHLDIVDMYCTENAISAYDREYLTWLIDFIRFEVQPQAVKLLKDKFPRSFGSADRETELSKNLGLVIYYKSCVIDGNKSPSGAMAYVSGDYKQDDFRLFMAYDAAEFTKINKDGKAVMNDEDKVNLENTVVHEMLHAFMNDYTRYGMYRTTGSEGTISKKEAFPCWFVEGFATAVQNGYQFRYSSFKRMYDEVQKKYTADSIRSGYLNKEGDMDDWLNLDYCEEDDNVGSAYAAGSLAVIYLGYLASMKKGNNPVQGDSIEMDYIRDGLDDILLWLHGEKTGKQADAAPLNNIITFVSGDRYKHVVEGITDTQSYSLSFIQGYGENGTYEVGDTEVLGSTAFLEVYLNWLENYDLKGKAEHANGSVLYDDQAYTSPIIEGEKPLPTSYRFVEQEAPGPIESTVDDVRANYTAGQQWCWDGTHSYALPDDQQDVAADAAPDVPAKEDEKTSIPDTETTEETPSETTEAVPAAVPEVITDAISDEITEASSEETSDLTSETTPVITPEVTTEETPEVTPDEIPGDAFVQDTTGDASEQGTPDDDSAQETPEGSSDDNAEETSDN